MSKTVDLKTPVFVLGQTEYTPLLVSHFQVQGIIDQTSSLAPEYSSINQVDLKSLNRDAVIISTVNNSRADLVIQNLKSLGFTNVLFIGELINQYPKIFENTFLAEAKAGMEQIEKQLNELYQSLEDQQSQEEFKQVVEFRKTLNIDHLSKFDVKIDAQYYEDFVVGQTYLNLIDGGAFDGYDSLRFTELFPDYQEIHVFEPEVENIAIVEKNLTSKANVKIHHACLGSSERIVSISGSGTSAKISQAGTIQAQQTTIDSLKLRGKTLVKLDIEGAEVDCLKGASNALDNPDFGFAVSAYHKPTDFWDIFYILKSAKVKRKFYFRHYSNGVFESVLFAI